MAGGWDAAAESTSDSGDAAEAWPEAGTPQRNRPVRVERIGVFGGTFDPVHVAHIVVAVDTRAALDLDRVLLVVAGDPWQKRGRVVASRAATG